MNKGTITKVFAGIVILVAVIVMFGWILDIPILKSILPGWVTMKFITALSFFFSGILILLISKKEKNELDKFFILVISFGLFLLMVTFLISLFLGISTGIESLFIKEQPGAIRTSVPGVPAIPTIFCFILIGFIGLLFIFNPKSIKASFWLGLIILIIGGLAILGYILNMPLLYYIFPGSTSMAFHTALLFVLMGTALILIKQEILEG